MLRLLQGDVGSGKTVVALFAAATAIEAGGQAAMMAPTELLVRQHARDHRARSPRPPGSDRGPDRPRKGPRARGDPRRPRRRRRSTSSSARTRSSSPASSFATSALAVVDEQHRFGVHQRLALTAKGGATDVLVMTATPIPRTLVLTYYGDMDVSQLDREAGRPPADRDARAPGRRAWTRSSRGSARRSRAARKAYWVCPLVEESEAIDVAAAEERFAALRKSPSATSVGLVHGRMPRGRDATR